MEFLLLQDGYSEDIFAKLREVSSPEIRRGLRLFI